jgi:propionyl-CoA carboxylase alpha chain
MLEACRKTKADAVHPGFGFLAENADFARRVEASGRVFIGPGAAAIEAMGDKIRSKRLAATSGVSVIPGHDGEITDAGQALKAAQSVGFPVMIKASAGGGGKGLRAVFAAEECAAAFERTTGEARSAFGDGRVFIEKLIERPRHIEIQILADAHGNIVHLGERECSIQRRHQKIIEEAPSPFLDDATRAAMGAQAVALARAVGYRSAGTVEFVVDRERRFYFLEMNTRIQVEHPVTEMITGIDIVAEQIRIAEGEALAWKQEDVRFSGHAIECRLCAEDPDQGFMPSTGKIRKFVVPAAPWFRLDSGVVEGDRLAASFDSMLAKFIVHGKDRAEAVARMRQALTETAVLGVTTNAGYLCRVLAHPDFAAGNLHTGFLAENEMALKSPLLTKEQAVVIISAALLANNNTADKRFEVSPLHSAMGAWRN